MRAGTRLLAWLALPNWPVFPGPQAQTVPSPRSALPGSRECGGPFAAISYPVLARKSAGGSKRAGWNAPERFLI